MRKLNWLWRGWASAKTTSRRRRPTTYALRGLRSAPGQAEKSGLNIPAF